MKLNPEITKFDRLRMITGTFFALAGFLIFLLSLFTLPFALIGAGLILLGVFVAKSARLAELVYKMLA